MLPPTFRNAGAFWIPAWAGLRLLGMTVWPVQTDNRKALAVGSASCSLVLYSDIIPTQPYCLDCMQVNSRR